MFSELNFLNIEFTAALVCSACQIIKKQMSFLLLLHFHRNKQKKNHLLHDKLSLIHRGAHVEKQKAVLLSLQRNTWHHSPENHCHSGEGDCDSLLYKDIQASNHGPFQMSN